jgi:hypothetical protein
MKHRQVSGREPPVIDPAAVDVLARRGPRAVHRAWEDRAWRRDEARRASAEAQPVAVEEIGDPDARRWRVSPREAALVRSLLPGVLSQEAAAAEVGVPRQWASRPTVVRALAEARAEVSARAQLTAEKVILELLDIEREARAAGQYAPAVRAVEVAAKIAGLFVERSVSVSVTASGQQHIDALMERMERRRAMALAAPADSGGGATLGAVVTPPTRAITVTYTESSIERSARAFDGFQQQEDD